MIVFTTITEESASYNTGSNRSSNYDTSVAQNLLQILSPNLSDVILLALNDTAEKSFQQTNGMTIQKVLETVNSSIGQLTNITRTLSNLIENTNSTGGKINDVLLVMQELLDLQNSSSLFKSIRQVSCKDIKAALPNSPSGYYHVNSRNIYCQMDELCGSERGWTRLAYLDMFDAQQKCPSGFRTYQTGGVRACGRLGGGADCTASIFYPSNGIYYSQVCGRVIGYQYSNPDANHPNVNNVNLTYIDGVNLTQGSSRQHIWTFMAGPTQAAQNTYNCPCSSDSTRGVQSFIGNHYYCESGNPNNAASAVLYTADPLWDGNSCLSLETECCTSTYLPWFYRDFGSTSSSEYLELRICGNEDTNDEDNPVGLIEIYIK